MNAIEFQATAHDGILDIPREHQQKLDGRVLRVVLVDAQAEDANEAKTIFARLRRIRIQGPADLSTNHDTAIIGEQDA
jgi:ferritin-like protein